MLRPDLLLGSPVGRNESVGAGVGWPTFRRLSDSTKDDWETIAAGHRHLATGLPDRLLAHLEGLAG